MDGDGEKDFSQKRPSLPGALGHQWVAGTKAPGFGTWAINKQRRGFSFISAQRWLVCGGANLCKSSPDGSSVELV